MGRMVKCCVTGTAIDSNNSYKIGIKWFKDKETYINHLKNKDITYQDILSLLTEDGCCIISNHAKDQIIKIIEEDVKQR